MIDPVFGRKDPKLDYHTRIGAYGVIPDHSGARLLILQAPNHALFLPGGGVEEGETPEVTLARELLEEFGATVHVTQKLGKSSEYFTLITVKQLTIIRQLFLLVINWRLYKIRWKLLIP